MVTLQRRQLLLGATAVGSLPLTTLFSSFAVIAEELPVLTDLDFLGEPGRWNSYSRERERTCDVVQAVEFTLSPTTVGSGVDTIIVADTVYIDGVVRTSSHSISIAARKIICREGSLIDTGGPDAVIRGDAAGPGVSPGAQGQDGIKGEDGKPAGNISIYAQVIEGPLSGSANGGAGARGQTGGIGAQGQTGSQGEAGWRDRRPQDGLPGGKGGTGGNGGPGGDGGIAGDINCFVISSPAIAPVFTAIGGRGGDEGDAGAPGAPGIGGNPGKNCFTDITVPKPDEPRGGWKSTHMLARSFCRPEWVPG